MCEVEGLRKKKKVHLKSHILTGECGMYTLSSHYTVYKLSITPQNLSEIFLEYTTESHWHYWRKKNRPQLF